MAGDRVRVLLALTSDPVKFLACMRGMKVDMVIHFFVWLEEWDG
uniref:Uncharacterized protein n=2 Tax=Oryza sativa subsp. japonica TaxID=39947 RepID=Q7G556_ORYSJ|nr:Unknown protein [Oryza sativa Japonica Group]AAP52239.1 hypothetical protein LOC_Os10g07329 [Oryza sativa Japonica Group]